MQNTPQENDAEKLPKPLSSNTLRMRQVGDFYVADNAALCGNVAVGKDVSVWFNASVRGDVAAIYLGDRVNVQEGAVLHCDGGKDLVIEAEVTIGHGAVVHGRRVGAGSLIGMKAVVLGDVTIGKGCIVAAGCVVSPGTVVPDGMVIMGIPGKVVRPVKPAEVEFMAGNIAHYVELARAHVQTPEKYYGVAEGVYLGVKS